ncbi:MAG: zinc ABC transporter substrate-binding protein, partial [Planctomycetota bacterium]
MIFKRSCRRWVTGVACLALWLTLGCSKSTGPGDKLNVVTTVGMVADLVREVGGDSVKVTQICGSGVDPHLYKPTRDDIQLLMDADVIFYCGLKLEGKMADTLDGLSSEQPVYAVTDAIDRGVLIGGDSDHADPHLWNDVALWGECLTLIRDRLSE